MKKNCTYPTYCLTLSLLWSILLLSSCNTSRFTANHTLKNAGDIALSEQSFETNDKITGNQATTLATTSIEAADQDDMPAAASTRQDIDIDLYAHPVELIRVPVARTTTPAETPAKANLGQQVQKKLSFPARMLMKSMVKKAEKLQKKDIKSAGAQKEVNNTGYLILGILLLAAGLVLVIVGTTNLVYILGAAASLTGLIFLLLALL